VKGNEYKIRALPKVLRHRNYDMNKLDDYKREMVLLYVPFKNEEVDILDQNRYRTLYDEHESEIMEARQEFESNLGMAKVIEECRRL